MTNAAIILDESIKLMQAGVLAGTGTFITTTILNDEGEEEEVQVELPEAIHTYMVWKKLGYKVKGGEKAIASFPIWKHTTKTIKDVDGNVELDDEGNPVTRSNMFMKVSAFFKASQVEEVK